MSDTDRTREKLLSSIRKTKAGAAKTEQPSPAQEPPKGEQSAQAPKTVKPAPSRPRPRRTQQTAQRERMQDPYQSGRRIWPD